MHDLLHFHFHSPCFCARAPWFRTHDRPRPAGSSPSPSAWPGRHPRPTRILGRHPTRTSGPARDRGPAASGPAPRAAMSRQALPSPPGPHSLAPPATRRPARGGRLPSSRLPLLSRRSSTAFAAPRARGCRFGCAAGGSVDCFAAFGSSSAYSRLSTDPPAAGRRDGPAPGPGERPGRRARLRAAGVRRRSQQSVHESGKSPL